ncbi:MAG: nickel-dependent hydrogenase large subunit, partial [Actinobacteria bacterium]|nr:nickel-dependent hydrogenase large subunit [Actinomycetota bacterium]
MHNIDVDFDINLEEISKIEGAASLSIKVRSKKVEELKFSITEWKRFYTQSIKGKPAVGVPQLVDRICGTCSNAHLLCSIKAIESAYNIKPSVQTILLRKLLYYGLIIRDHALHLYIFALPDIFNKSSILDFDESDQMQHKLLEDTFSVKETFF